MEESTPAKKRSFGFRRKSDDKKSGGSSGHSKIKKKSGEHLASADASGSDLGTEQFCETPKAPEDTELKQELQQAGKERGKKFKKKHFRHFSFHGGKFHKHKGKNAAETADREIDNDTSASSECFETETTASSAAQSSSNTRDVDDVQIQEADDEAMEPTKESGESPAVSSASGTVTEGCIVETVTPQVSDPEKEEKPREGILSARKDAEVADQNEGESSDPAVNAVPLAIEENFETESCVQGKTNSATNEQNKCEDVPGQSSQSEGDKIGDHARESEFQMTKEEQAVEIPSSSPKETTTEKNQSNEGESNYSAADEVGPEIPKAAEDKPTQPPEDDTCPKSPEAQEESAKQPDAKEENAVSPGIGAIYEALLHVKESLISGEKQSSIDKISGIPYEICQLTIDTGRTKLSNLFGFLLGQAGYSTRHMLSYFVKILIQKYPHCFQVKTNGKRKKSKEHRNDGTGGRLDTVC